MAMAAARVWQMGLGTRRGADGGLSGARRGPCGGEMGRRRGRSPHVKEGLRLETEEPGRRSGKFGKGELKLCTVPPRNTPACAIYVWLTPAAARRTTG